MDCNAENFETAEEWLACSGEFVGPVIDAILPIAGLVVTLAVLLAGVRFARKVVKEFAR